MLPPPPSNLPKRPPSPERLRRVSSFSGHGARNSDSFCHNSFQIYIRSVNQVPPNVPNASQPHPQKPGTPILPRPQSGPAVQWAGRSPPQESQKAPPPTQALKHQPCDPSVPEQSSPTPLRSSPLQSISFSPQQAYDTTAKQVKIEKDITAHVCKVDSPSPTPSLATKDDTFMPSVTTWENYNVPSIKLAGLQACATADSTALAREMTRAVIDHRLRSQLFRQDNMSNAAVTACERTYSYQTNSPPKRSGKSGWNPGVKCEEGLYEANHPAKEPLDDIASSADTRASKRMKVSHAFSGWFGKKESD